MTVDKAALTGTWVHSHEEDSAQQRVYRPDTYKFPPSRGRSGFDLHADGTMSEYGPAATDTTSTRPGRWEILPDRRVALFAAGAHAPTRVLKVAAVSRDKLVVEP
ncbi:MAG: hypothetical protein ABI537_10120 [Casimicrobiaceae bacterium]